MSQDVVEVPEEGDWMTADYRIFVRYAYPNAWKGRIEVGQDQDWKQLLKRRMKEDSFWSNVWHVSDHDNWSLLKV